MPGAVELAKLDMIPLLELRAFVGGFVLNVEELIEVVSLENVKTWELYKIGLLREEADEALLELKPRALEEEEAN